MTLRDFFNYYISNYADIHCKSSADFKRTFRLYLQSLADKDLSQVKRTDIIQLQAKLTQDKSPGVATRAVILMCMLYNKAIDWEMHEGKNPAANIRKFKHQPRERFLQPHELAPFFQAVASLRSETTRDYLLILLFTGQRRKNVCQMRWAELDLNLKIWEIPRTKNGTRHTVPLTIEAVTILTRRANQVQKHSEWVFPKEDATGPIWCRHTAWKAVLKRAGLADLRIHDLRRTLASYQAMTGASLPIIGKTLNHKNPASTQIYARLNLAPVRDAMELAIKSMTG